VPVELPHGMSVEGLGLRRAAPSPALAAAPMKAKQVMQAAKSEAPRREMVEDRAASVDELEASFDDAFDAEYAAEEPTGAGMQVPEALSGEPLEGEPAPEDVGESSPEPERQFRRRTPGPVAAPPPPPQPPAAAPRMPARTPAPRPEPKPASGAFTGKPREQVQPRRLIGRIVLRRGRELVLEILVGGGELAWKQLGGVAAVARDGRLVPAQIRAEGTTHDGAYPEGVWIRVVLELLSDEEQPLIEVTLSAGGEALTVAIQG